MSERIPAPDPSRFPDLDEDPRWIREVRAGTLIARIFRAAGRYPADWHTFREFGPLDGRFDPHSPPVGEHPGVGVLYGILEHGALTQTEKQAGKQAQSGTLEPSEGGLEDTAFAAAILEVFQAQRMIRVGDGAPTLVGFEPVRTLRLLDLSDSDWVTVAGGNSAISSGERMRSRAWARAIFEHYPDIDGVVAASSLVPTARVATLWTSAANALPDHPSALIRLDRPELAGVIDRIAERYGYVVLHDSSVL